MKESNITIYRCHHDCIYRHPHSSARYYFDLNSHGRQLKVSKPNNNIVLNVGKKSSVCYIGRRE
jgi:hypothetical protein